MITKFDMKIFMIYLTIVKRVHLPTRLEHFPEKYHSSHKPNLEYLTAFSRRSDQIRVL